MKLIVIGAIVTLLLTPITALFMVDNYLIEDDEQVRRDSIPPISDMNTFPKVIVYPENVYTITGNQFSSPEVLIKWYGHDNPKGSGIQSYDVQYMRNYLMLDPDKSYPMVMPFWQDWQVNTTNTSAIFYPSYDSLYYFRCRARDNAGNVETWPPYFDSFAICIGFELPTPYSKIPEELIEWEETIEHKLSKRLDQLKDIQEMEVKEIINEIRANEVPIADAGEDKYGYIDASPILVEKPSDFIKGDYPYERFPFIQFNGSGSYDPDGEVINYIWNFGDGTLGFGEQSTHTYVTTGKFNVTLMVIDDYGAISKDQLTCTIDVAY
jgi:hypothetical protein